MPGSILVKDTTREERVRIVSDAIGNTDGLCDGCACGITVMYEDYIEGRKELRDVNLEFSQKLRCGPNATGKMPENG